MATVLERNEALVNTRLMQLLSWILRKVIEECHGDPDAIGLARLAAFVAQYQAAPRWAVASRRRRPRVRSASAGDTGLRRRKLI